jgi:hypothetical protein
VHERGVPVGQRDGDSGGHDGTLPWSELYVRGGAEVGAGVTGMGALGQRKARIQALDEDADAVGFGLRWRHGSPSSGWA